MERTPPPELDAALARIDPAELRRIVDTLCGFGTRHTLSDTESETRGIGAALRFVRDEFERVGHASGRTGADAVRVWFDEHDLEPDGRRILTPTRLVNVAAAIPGTDPASSARCVYLIAHLDSRATDVMDAEIDAPGANDDASGVAALVEVARVLAPLRFAASIVFLAVTGEEQGLVGSRRHARAAREAGADICAVLSNDMVGDPSGPAAGPFGCGLPGDRTRVRVFSQGLSPAADAASVRRTALLGGEADSQSRQLARYVQEIAALHGTAVQPQLVHRNDRFLRGGDHTAFVEQGYAGVRFTEVHEKYTRQHQDVRDEDGTQFGDTPEHIDVEYLADVARIDAAALAHIASAPAAPASADLVVESLANDTTLRWTRSVEPHATGYEVVWRETTAPAWEHARDVGDVDEVTLPLSKDNWLFGVRAYDARGFRSLVVFPGVATGPREPAAITAPSD